MADTPHAPIGGYIVRVASPRMGGAYPVLDDFIVNAPDPAQAETIIQATLSPDESIEGIRPVPLSRMPSDLPPGAYRPWL